MRRSLLSVLFAVLLCLTGCLGKTASPVTEQFTCAFTGTYKEMQLAGTIEREDAGTLTMTLSAPPSLAGLVCRLENDDMTLSLGELEYKTAVIPAAAVPQILREMLDTLPQSTKEDTADTAVIQYSGTAEAYAFTALVSTENGALQSLSVPDAELEMQFTDVQKLPLK